MKKTFYFLLCWAYCLVASAQTADGQRKQPLDSLEFHDLLVAMCDMKNETFHSVDMMSDVVKELASFTYKVNGTTATPWNAQELLKKYADSQLKEDFAAVGSDVYLQAFGDDEQAFRTAVAGLYKKNGIVLRALDKAFISLLGRLNLVVASAPDAGQAITLANELMVLEGEAVTEEFYQAFEKFYKEAGYPAFIEYYLTAPDGSKKQVREKYQKVANYLKAASVDFFACHLYNNGVTVEVLQVENPAVPLHGKLLHCYHVFQKRNGKELARDLVPEFQNWAYPPQARAQHEEGVVVVRYQVLEDGRIGEVQVEQSSQSPALDQEAVRVVKSFPRFVPARHQGVAVSYWRKQTFNYSLRDANFEYIQTNNRPERVRNAIKDSQRNFGAKTNRVRKEVESDRRKRN